MDEQCLTSKAQRQREREREKEKQRGARWQRKQLAAAATKRKKKEWGEREEQGKITERKVSSNVHVTVQNKESTQKDSEWTSAPFHTHTHKHTIAWTSERMKAPAGAPVFACISSFSLSLWEFASLRSLSRPREGKRKEVNGVHFTPHGKWVKIEFSGSLSLFPRCYRRTCNSRGHRTRGKEEKEGERERERTKERETECKRLTTITGALVHSMVVAIFARKREEREKKERRVWERFTPWLYCWVIDREHLPAVSCVRYLPVLVTLWVRPINRMIKSPLKINLL